MTKEQEQKYIKNPTYCPYCNSRNLDAEVLHLDGNQAYTNVECSNCKKEWTEIYTLTHIEEVVAP